MGTVIWQHSIDPQAGLSSWVWQQMFQKKRWKKSRNEQVQDNLDTREVST